MNIIITIKKFNRYTQNTIKKVRIKDTMSTQRGVKAYSTLALTDTGTYKKQNKPCSDGGLSNLFAINSIIMSLFDVESQIFVNNTGLSMANFSDTLNFPPSKVKSQNQLFGARFSTISLLYAEL